MDRPAWSTYWYSGIVTACLIDPQAKVVDSKTGKMTQTACKVLKWIKDCRGHELWQLCCNLIQSINRLNANNPIDVQEEYVKIWSIVMDELEYMKLLVKEFSSRPAELWVLLADIFPYVLCVLTLYRLQRTTWTETVI